MHTVCVLHGSAQSSLVYVCHPDLACHSCCVLPPPGPQYVILSHLQPVQSFCGSPTLPSRHPVAGLPGHRRGDRGTPEDCKKLGKELTTMNTLQEFHTQIK